jgi:6-pyruvoyltetrahydropterin/6-carboxytetrahydropterin synthase
MGLLDNTVVAVPFNPTVENMAFYLLKHIGPIQLMNTGVKLVRVVLEETRKCSAVAELEESD